MHLIVWLGNAVTIPSVSSCLTSDSLICRIVLKALPRRHARYPIFLLANTLPQDQKLLTNQYPILPLNASAILMPRPRTSMPARCHDRLAPRIHQVLMSHPVIHPFGD